MTVCDLGAAVAGDRSGGAGCAIARIATGLLGIIFFRLGLAERVCCGEIGAANTGMTGVAAAAVNESGPGMPGTNGINLPPWTMNCACGGGSVSGLYAVIEFIGGN